MNDRILVAYASRAGSTAGVAAAIAKVLSGNGVGVDLRRFEEVANLDGYRAVVAGSAIQGGQWLPEALHFVQAQRSALAEKPFAAFLVCMTLSMRQSDQYRAHVATWLAPVRTLVKPMSEGLFAGALDIAKVPSLADRLKFRISVAMGVWSEGDHRDWNAIGRWAESIRPRLVQ